MDANADWQLLNDVLLCSLLLVSYCLVTFKQPKPAIKRNWNHRMNMAKQYSKNHLVRSNARVYTSTKKDET